MSMRRRDTLPLIVAMCAAPLAAQQAGKVYRIALLSAVPMTLETSPALKALIDGLRELGWIQGQHYTFDLVSGPNERLPGIAAELVQRKVDLIIAGGTPPAQAAKAATSTIPIVFWYVGDPVGAGLVASLARPGGNITGMGGLGPGTLPRCSSC
jgi:putative tryptophan/tyrosine transport system substrate-binding protein